MSFTCIVPPTVPSVLHSSRPVMPSSAENSSALFKTVKAFGEEPAPGLMSFTRIVPLSVPSLFHNSKPVMPSSALKYKALLNTVKPDGEESPDELIFFTCTVPGTVPSLFHSSRPLTPSSAEKYKALLNTVSPVGEELLGTWIPPMETVPGAMSFTSTVRASVPSVFHSSRPLTPSSAEKYKALPRTVNSRGEETTAVTRAVPACVPSLFHSLGPVPSSAEKNHAPLKKANSEGKRPLPPGEECPAPGLMSFTKTVPMALPSVFHSSKPLTPSLPARSMMLGELRPLAPPPHPANAKADASARALVTLHSGPIECLSRWIMAPTFHPRDRPRLSLQPAVLSKRILPSCVSDPRSGTLRSHSPYAGVGVSPPRRSRTLVGAFSGLDQRPVPRLELARLLLRFQPLGNVADHGQARRPTIESEIEGDDFDVDLLPILLEVSRHALHVGTARVLKVLEQLRDILRRAELLGGHRQKLLPRVAVMLDGRLVYGEETQGFVFHHPHRTGMDVEQHPVALFAVFQVLQPARLFRDVFSDAVVPLEFAQRVENRLAGHAQITHFAGTVGNRVHEVAERLVTLELFAVLLPGFFRKGPGTLKLPARLADECFRIDPPLLHAGQLDEAKILVLHPVPVRAHLDHAAEPRFTRLQRFLGELELGDVVNQRDRAQGGARAVPHERPGDPHPDRRAALVHVALFIDARLGRRDELLLEVPGRLPIVGVGDLFKAFFHQLLIAVADQAAQRFVDAQKAAVERSDRDPDRGLREERVEQGIAIWHGGPTLRPFIRFQ